MKLKNVAHAISGDKLSQFLYILQLSYKPSLFAGAKKPYAMDQGIKN